MLGIICGYVIAKIFRIVNIAVASKIIILLSLSYLLTALENVLEGTVPIASLLSIMSMGAVLFRLLPDAAKDIALGFGKLWSGAEILLFTLVGAAVNINYAAASFIGAAAVIVFAMIFRMVGVQICLFRTILNKKERLFSAFSYLPKATVQAAIGSVPLAMGLACGKTVLTIAVWAIFITAPAGAALIDFSYKKLLEKEIL